MKNHNSFRYFKTSPEIILLAVMMYVRFPLSPHNAPVWVARGNLRVRRQWCEAAGLPFSLSATEGAK